VNGHGSAVAGLIGARDNAIGVVGVAPDVRLWSVRVGDKNGSVKDSDLLCGLDWVAQHSDVIGVANLSLSGDQTDTGNCGNAEVKKDQDPVHQAICRVVGVGVTVVAAAGNETRDASLNYPASYDEVITVSGISDSDGQAGGLGTRTTCALVQDPDDTFASFSNFGADVDIAAPGTCLRTTYMGGLYATATGTSFSAPIVAGAAALYIANHLAAIPAQVKQALIGTWEAGPIAGDPDTFPEGIVNVSTF
jgi:subtilisin family serine protease